MNKPTPESIRQAMAAGDYQVVEPGQIAGAGLEFVPVPGLDVRNAWSLTRDANPDEVAERSKLARQMGLDAVTARTMDLHELRMRADLGADFDVLQAEAPGLMEWAARPENMAVARDDLSNLRAVEGEIRQAPLPYTLHDLEEGAKDVARNLLGSVKGLADYFREMDRRALAGLSPEAREKEIARREGMSDLAKTFALGPEDLRAVSDWAAEGVADEKLERLDFPTREGLAGYWDDVVRTAPQIISQILTTTAAGHVAGMAFMGAQIGGGQYLDLTSRGVDPVRAFHASLANASLQAPLEQIGIGRALKVWKPGAGVGRVFRGLLEGGGTEFFTEWLQKYPEAASEIWGLAQQKGQTPQEQVDEFFNRFGEFTAQGIYEGLVAMPFGGLTGGVNAAAQTSIERAKAADLAVHLERLKELAGLSKLATRDDARFADFVDRVSAEEGFSHVYVPAEAVQRFAQAAGTDAEAWIEDYGVDWNEWAEARITGGTVRLPVGQVVTHLTSDDVLQELRPIMRREPGDWSEGSLDEEAADAREAQALLQQRYQEEEKRMAAPEAVRQIRDQIQAMGYTPEQAALHAALYEHRANTWARKSGGTAADWFARKNLRFERGAAPEGGYAQAAMYRNDLSLGDFVARALEEPGAKDSWVPVGTTPQGEEIGLSASAVRHISKGHPEYADWERIGDVVAGADEVITGRKPKRKVYVSYDQGQGHAVVLEQAKNRAFVVTAFKGGKNEIEAWARRKAKEVSGDRRLPRRAQAPQGGDDIQITSSVPENITSASDQVKGVWAAVAPFQTTAVNALPLRVVDTEAELPEALRAAHQQGDGPLRGGVDQGVVWLAAEHLATPEEAQSQWRHEQGLHRGLPGFFGVEAGGERAVLASRRLDGFLDRVFEHGGEESFQIYRDEYGLDFSKPEHRRIAAEERLARIAERLDLGEDLNAADRSAWDAFLAFLRDLARDMGLDLALTDEEIIATVRGAMRWTMEGEGGAQRYAQPMNPGLDPDMEMRVIEAEPRFQGQNPLVLRKRFPREIVDAILDKDADGQPRPVRNEHTGWDIEVTKSGVDHAVGRTGGHAGESTETMLGRLEVLPHLRDILRHAVLIETHADRKDQFGIGDIHRFYAPVRIGDDLHAVRVTVKESRSGGSRVEAVDVKRFYSAAVDKTMPAGTSQARPEAIPGPSAGMTMIKIRTLLDGVKDAYGESYVPAQRYAQPANADVDPDMEMRVVDLSDVAPVTIGGPQGKAWAAQWEGAPLEIETRTRGRWTARLRGRKTRDKQHPFWSSRQGRPRQDTARRKALAALDKVLDATVLIESFPNRKTDGKPDVETVHWLYVPVRTGGKTSLLRITAFERKGTTPQIDGVEVYDLLPKGKLPTAATSKRGRGAGPEGSTITIRAMLARVKDADGNPYVFSQGDRAEVLFRQAETVVRTFNGANLSSLLHENGHVFLEDLAESAAQGVEEQEFEDIKAWFERNAAQVVVELRGDAEISQALGERGGADYVAGLARGLSGFASKDAVDAAVLARFHEMFARGFEAWLREGKAPSLELDGAFARFRAWLVRIYRSVRGLSVNLDDEVRRVMERMLATEEQIEAAARVRGMVRMMDGLEEVGMSEVDAAEYRRLAAEAQAKAAARLEREKNRDRNARLRAWREEIETEVDERQGIRTVRWLSRGEGPRTPKAKAVEMEAAGRSPQEIMDATGWYRTEAGGWGNRAMIGPGLNKADFLVRYGIEDVEKLPRTVPPLLRDDGLPLDMAAVEAGYETADDMMQDIFNTKSRAQIVEETLRAREAAWDGQADPQAQLGGEDYARLLELESEALARMAGNGKGRAMQARALRSWAESQTAQASLSEARDVAKLLADAKRNRVAAIRAQRENRYADAFAANENLRRIEALLAVRYKVRTEIPDILRRMKRLARGKRLTNAYREQILGVLERYGLGSPTMRPNDPDGRSPLFRFLAPGGGGVMDVRPDFPDWLLGEQRAGDYSKTFTLGDLRDADRLVRHLVVRGRMAADEALSKDGMRISERAARQAEAMHGLGDKKVWAKGSVMRTLTAPGRKWLPEISNQLYMLKMADGWSNQGPDGAMGPNEEMAGWIIEALNEEKRLWARFGVELQPLLDHFSRRLAEESKRLDLGVPVTKAMREHGIEAWTMEMVFAAALNCGNNGNLLALVDGYGLVEQETLDQVLKQAKQMRMNPEETKRRVQDVKVRLGWEKVRKLCQPLTDEDWRVIQATWDLINSAYPVLDATYKKMTGVPMKKVEARPFLAPSGSGVALMGGYYPLVFDGRFADSVKTWQEVEDWLDGEGQFQTPSARSGFVNERVGTSLPPRLDLGVISQHLGDVLHYATHAPVLKDVDRITREAAWADEFKRVFGVEAYAQIRPWLKHIARREKPPVGQFHQLVEQHRRLATIAILGLNTSVALKQPFSLFGAATEMGWGPMLAGVGMVAARRGEMVAQVNELSVYMAQRSSAWDREIQAALMRSQVDKRSVWIKGKEYGWRDVQDFSFVLIRMMDSATVYPIWAGAHAKAVAEGMAPDEAVAYADRIVRDTQPSADAVDLAAWQRGHGIYRLFSMFMTFTLKWGQRQRFYLGGWRQGKVSTRRMMRHVAYEWLLPPMVMSLMLSLLRTGEPPEPKDLLLEMLGYQVAGYPILNQVLGAVQYNRGLMESPASRGVDILWTAARKGFDAARGEVDERTFWALGEALSYSSGLPVAKVLKTARDGLDSNNPFNLIMTNPKRRR
ncbi:LPD3 domain-containing protein [Desulfocurvus sp. DL9XJH121]